MHKLTMLSVILCLIDIYSHILICHFWESIKIQILVREAFISTHLDSTGN